MCGKGSCAGSSQLHCIIYTHTSSVFQSLPQQNSLFSDNSLVTTLADAPGFHFPLSSPSKGEDKGEGDKRAGRSWAIGLPYRGHHVAFFTSSLWGVPMDFGATM